MDGNSTRGYGTWLASRGRTAQMRLQNEPIQPDRSSLLPLGSDFAAENIAR